MWPLLRDFFTVKSAAVRVFRVLGVSAGAMVAAKQLPVPEGWEWMGYAIAAIAAAVTDQPSKDEE